MTFFDQLPQSVGHEINGPATFTVRPSRVGRVDWEEFGDPAGGDRLGLPS